jgi:hypothetical protein
MSNPYYNPSGNPVTDSSGSSLQIRTEFAAVAAGFALFPNFSAYPNYVMTVNAGATALVPSTNIQVSSITAGLGTFTTLTGNLTGNVTGNLTGSAQQIYNSITPGSYLSGNAFNGLTAQTWAVNAATANTPSTVVARDGSGNFSAGTITASLNGSASSATTATTASALANALTIGAHLTGGSFNGSGAVTIASDATALNTPSTTVARDGSGGFIAGTITANLAGNASTATTATTATTANALAKGSLTAFTPVLLHAGSASGFTYTTQSGYYLQVGDLVYFSINIVASAVYEPGADAVTISGLGIAAASSIGFAYPLSAFISGGYTFSSAYYAGSSVLLYINGSTYTMTNFGIATPVTFNIFGYFFAA